MKKLLFTAVLLTAFSGFANVKNTAKNVATMQNTSVLAIKKVTQKDLEKKMHGSATKLAKLQVTTL